MAPKSKLSSKGFTLLEMTVTMLIFIIAVAVGIVSYTNLLRTNAMSQNVYSSINNLTLGFEKIWRELKYGSRFQYTEGQSLISFKDFNCMPVTIELNKNAGTLIYTKDGIASVLNDPSLVFVKELNFIVSSNKASITVASSADAITTKFKIPINLQISVAPINAPFPKEPCD